MYPLLSVTVNIQLFNTGVERPLHTTHKEIAFETILSKFSRVIENFANRYTLKHFKIRVQTLALLGLALSLNFGVCVCLVVYTTEYIR